jgi:MFS family permease
MFRLELFKIRAFTFGSLSTFLSALARGGLMFMLIIWLQGIWLPQHGYDYSSTPLWAGICMLPLSVGIVLAGPLSGHLSDRFGARPFATGGMVVLTIGFVLLEFLSTNFSYILFGGILLLCGIGSGAFGSPNRAGVMNALPADHRGSGGGMNTTFQNSAQVLSIGVFFSLMIAGLATSLPRALGNGLRAAGVHQSVIAHVTSLPPVSVLFAAFLGYNPLKQVLGTKVLASLPHAAAVKLTSRVYFPSIISAPFRSGLHEAFTFAAICCVVAAVASWWRGGGHYVHGVSEQPTLRHSHQPVDAVAVPAPVPAASRASVGVNATAHRIAARLRQRRSEQPKRTLPSIQ